MRSRVATSPVVLAGVGLLYLLSPGAAPTARADFPLPILNRVEKTLSVPSDIDPQDLERFRPVADLNIEIRLLGGNLVPGRLLDKLKSDFPGRHKIFQMQGTIEPRHVEALRGLNDFEIWYRVRGTIDRRLVNDLHSFGPVRRVVILPADFQAESLAQLTKLGNSALALDVGTTIPEAQLRLLAGQRRRRKYLLLGSDWGHQVVFQASELNQVELVVPTNHNQVAEPLLRLLARLRGIRVTFVVDGRLTMEDARRLARVEELGLKVRLENPPQVIPGLVGLLQQLQPP